VQKQIAEWNTELKLWSKPSEGLFSERLELFSETWPTSGMTQNGQAFELVMPERPINDSEFSSLPTLKARDHQAEGYEAGLRRTTPQLGTIVKGIVDEDERVMLPTPRANEPGSTSVGYGDSLNDFANRVVNGYARKDIELLRSPTASQGQGGALGEAEARKRGNTVGIRDQAMDLAKLQGHRVSREVANLPTPTVSDQYTGNLTSTQQKPGSMHSVTLAQVFHKPDLFPTPNTMEHREVKTPEQIAALKAKSPGGYRNLRETVINELFPTPITSDYKNGKSSAGYGLNLPETAKSLMPTPKALDGVKGNLKTSQERLESGHQVDLPNVAIDLSTAMLPTPQVDDSKNTGHNQTRRTTLASEVWANHETNWGKFEPAIRRWESIIGRPAPEPTKPDGKDGNHRLSSKFTEWMMGLPDGWITGHDLKRNDELKLAGNGVVPQQAELALSLLGIKEILERS
jgi:hypothetical protein